MCDIATGLAAASLVVGVTGTAVGMSQQRSVAQAQMNAQVQAQEAQSQAFFQRMNAQGAQNTRDAATQQAAMDQNTAAQTQLEQDQKQALAQREQQIDAANTQTQTIGQSAQRLAQNAQDATSAENQAKAAAAEKAQITAMAAPGVSNIASGTQNTPTGPVAAPVTGDNETSSAIATRLAQAASATRDYAGREATVASYQAPLTLMTTTTQNLGAETAPLTAEQHTVESGLRARLEPSTVAYQSAGNYYQNLLRAIQARTQGQLNVSKAIASGNITNADLAQADTTTQAQNKATLAQYNAAMNPTASILSGLGQIGMFGAGAAGAFQPGSALGDALSGGKDWLGNTLGFYTGPSATSLISNAGDPASLQVALKTGGNQFVP